MGQKSEVLVVISLFRNRGFHVQRFIERMENLNWDGEVHVVCIENDSTDSTRTLLDQWAKKNNPKSLKRRKNNLSVHVIGESTGEPMTYSEVSRQRFRILADAANKGFDYIEKINPDYVMFIESDIVHSSELALLLKDRVDKTGGVVAPMVWTENNKIFYDFWAFRIHGQHFPAKSQIWYVKYWPHVGTYEVDSVGTCLMVKYDWVKNARLTEDEAIVGLCREIKDKEGVKIYVDRDIHIFHPQ